MNTSTTSLPPASQAPTCDKQHELGAWHSAGASVPPEYVPPVTQASLLREALTLQADIVTGVMDLITNFHADPFETASGTLEAIAALLSSPKMTTATKSMHAALTAFKI